MGLGSMLMQQRKLREARGFAAFNATLESRLFWQGFRMGLGSMLMQQRKLREAWGFAALNATLESFLFWEGSLDSQCSRFLTRWKDLTSQKGYFY
jgi:hypothetical protein